MMGVEYTREIKVRVYVDTNKRTYDEEHAPDGDETLSDLLRRLADKYEDQFT